MLLRITDSSSFLLHCFVAQIRIQIADNFVDKQAHKREVKHDKLDDKLNSSL